MSVSILIVDDEPDVAEMFRQRFRREVRDGTYVVHIANSGEMALEQLSGGIEPELIVMRSDPMPEAGMPEGSVVRVEFHDVGDRTRVIVNDGPFPPGGSEHAADEARFTGPGRAGERKRRVRQRRERPVRRDVEHSHRRAGGVRGGEQLAVRSRTASHRPPSPA